MLEEILTDLEQRGIVNAAVLAEDGREAEAEASRYAADYHNLEERPDADGAPLVSV